MFCRILNVVTLIAGTALFPLACKNRSVVEPPTPPSETPVVDGDGASGTISVSPGTTYQTMDGFGTSMRLWDDPHLNGLPVTAPAGGMQISEAQRDTIYDLLYSPTAGIGLNRLRVSLIEPGWQTREGGAIVPDGPSPGPRATAILDFIRKARIRNPDLRAGFEIGRYDAWISSSTSPLAIARYIKTALDYARPRGELPDWVGIQNEPTNGPPYFSGENLRDIAIELKNLLTADAYATSISVPDDLNDDVAAPKAEIILADPDARSSISTLSTHLYGNERPTRMSTLAQRYNLPLWMTEYDDRSGGHEVGWASTIIHEMLVTYNCSAVDMLFGFFGAPLDAASPVTYIALHSNGTAYKGYSLNSSYYEVGQWSKYVTRGSVRIAATSTNPNVKVSAFVRGGKKIIVLVHIADTGESVAIPGGAYRLVRTQMSGTDRLTYKGVFSTAVTLPKMSITTLIEQ